MDKRIAAKPTLHDYSAATDGVCWHCRKSEEKHMKDIRR